MNEISNPSTVVVVKASALLHSTIGRLNVEGRRDARTTLYSSLSDTNVVGLSVTRLGRGNDIAAVNVEFRAHDIESARSVWRRALQSTHISHDSERVVFVREESIDDGDEPDDIEQGVDESLYALEFIDADDAHYARYGRPAFPNEY